MGREFLEIARHAVVKPRPDGDQAIALVNGVVGVFRSMHADHAKGKRMILGQGADPEQGGHDGDFALFGNCDNLFLASGDIASAAAIQQRALGLLDDPRGFQIWRGWPSFTGRYERI